MTVDERARSIPVGEEASIPDGDAYGLQVQDEADYGGAGRRLGALRAPLRLGLDQPAAGAAGARRGHRVEAPDVAVRGGV